ncbi:MAG: hypothetical protein WKG07_08320 [Hymenobacter sp.]
MAYLVSPALQATFMLSPILCRSKPTRGGPSPVGFFGDEGAAIEWLRGA